MKIKKVLCSVLATVMAASVLSVGMITSAMAAYPADDNAKSVTVPSALLLNNTNTDFTSAVKPASESEAQQEYNGVYFTKIKSYDEYSTQVDNQTEIVFKTPKSEDGCWLTIVINRQSASSSGHLKITGGTNKYDTENGAALSTGYEITNLDEGVIFHLEGEQVYTIVGTSSGSAVKLDELEFTATKPVKVLRYGSGGSSGTKNAAIFEDGEGNRYAAAIVRDDKLAQAQVYLKSETNSANSQSSDTVYKGVTIGTNSYSAREFASDSGHTDYIYVVKLTDGNDDSTLKQKTGLELQGEVNVSFGD